MTTEGRPPRENENLRAPPTAVVVDDAPEVRALVKARLRLSRRFEVVGEGCDGVEAVDLARRLHPELMVLDVSMPRMDGLEALPAVIAESPGTAVVMYSGFEERNLAGVAIELGAAGFVEKSELIERLPDVLESMLDAARAARACGADLAGAAATASARARGGGARAHGREARPGTRRPRPAPGDGWHDVAPDGDGIEDGAGVETAAGLCSARGAAGGDEHAEAASTLARHDQHVLDDHLERFREVFEDAAIGMATMTLAGRIVRANRAIGETLGVSPVRLIGAQYAGMADATGARALATAFADFHAGSAVRPVQLEHLVDAGGGNRRVLTTLAPVLDSNRRPLYLFLQVQDLTPQVAAAERLHQSEQRFRLLVEAVQDYAIFMLDPEGHIASWNAGAQRIKGYSADEIIGQHFRVFYPPEQQVSGHPEHELEIALRDGRYEEEGWRVRKDGSRFWALVVITAVRDGAGRHIGFGKVTRDVTERRALMQELESANERLSRAAAEQSAFLGVTAHELRGPISVLSGSADLLAEHLDELSPDEREGILASMATSATRLRRLLADLIMVSRLEAGRIELQTRTVEVRDALLAASVSARRLFGDIPIEVECDPSLTALADPDRLAQMLDNLVGNAISHGVPPVRLAARNGGGRVEIRVEDTGHGVPEAFRSKLFGRFVTSAPQRGTGLGLFIVRELARAQGGEAWYEEPSGARMASTFAVSLPAGVRHREGFR